MHYNTVPKVTNSKLKAVLELIRNNYNGLVIEEQFKTNKLFNYGASPVFSRMV